MQTASIHGLAAAERGWFGTWGVGWPWGLLWLGFAVLFWGGLLALLVWAVRSVSGPRRSPDTAAQILKRRLASGEISQEEYERIRQLLEN